MSNTTPIKINAAKICGTAFAAISIYCSALLWWSFADTLINQITAVAIGGGFVACQYLFHSNKNYIATTTLFIVSAAATIGWIESRYDTIKTTELNSDSSYSEKTKTLTELNNTLALQNLSAKNDLANTTINFTGRANRTLTQAKQTRSAITQIEREIAQQKNSNPSSQKSGVAIANNLAEYRWALWFLLAAMIDIIPMICFAIVKAEADKETTESNVKNDTNNDTRNVADTIKNNNGKGWKPVPQQDATISSIVAEQDELTETIATEIDANHYGDKPSQRNVMKQHNLRHERTKLIFEQLVQMDVIQPQGNRYIRTQLQIQTKAQEQSA